jgi:hypothetical protein
MVDGFTTTYAISAYKTLCDKVFQWLATGQWFSPCPLVSSTNKTDRHDIAEILLKMALNTIKPIFLCIPCLPVTQDCTFLIAPSVFSNVYFHLPYSQSGPFLIHDRVITGFVTRVISGNTTGATCEGGTVYLSGPPEFIQGCDGICIARSLVFCVVFCRSLLSLFFWSFTYFLSFDLRLLISPLINFIYGWLKPHNDT